MAYHHQAECRSPNGLIETVLSPALRRQRIQLVAPRVELNPLARPSTNGSAAVPPCPITPLWMPNLPVINAERLGRHGASDT